MAETEYVSQRVRDGTELKSTYQPYEEFYENGQKVQVYRDIRVYNKTDRETIYVPYETRRVITDAEGKVVSEKVYGLSQRHGEQRVRLMQESGPETTTKYLRGSGGRIHSKVTYETATGEVTNLWHNAPQKSRQTPPKSTEHEQVQTKPGVWVTPIQDRTFTGSGGEQIRIRTLPRGSLTPEGYQSSPSSGGVSVRTKNQEFSTRTAGADQAQPPPLDSTRSPLSSPDKRIAQYEKKVAEFNAVYGKGRLYEYDYKAAQIKKQKLDRERAEIVREQTTPNQQTAGFRLKTYPEMWKERQTQTKTSPIFAQVRTESADYAATGGVTKNNYKEVLRSVAGMPQDYNKVVGRIDKASAYVASKEYQAQQLRNANKATGSPAALSGLKVLSFGAATGMLDVAMMIRHPVRTVKSFATAITHPKQTWEGIKAHAVETPLGFTGELLGQIAASELIFRIPGIARAQYAKFGSEYVPAQEVFSTTTRELGGTQVFPTSRNVAEIQAKWEASRTAEGIRAVHTSIKPLKTQEGEVVIGAPQTTPRGLFYEDPGLYVAPYGEGSPHFLGTKPSSYKISLLPRLPTQPTATIVSGISEVKRIPSKIVEIPGYEGIARFFKEHPNEVYIPKRSELAFNPDLIRLSTSRAGTTETQAVITPNSLLTAQAYEDWIARFKGYKKYTTVNERIVPLREFRITTAEQATMTSKPASSILKTGAGYGEVTITPYPTIFRSEVAARVPARPGYSSRPTELGHYPQAYTSPMTVDYESSISVMAKSREQPSVALEPTRPSRIRTSPSRARAITSTPIKPVLSKPFSPNTPLRTTISSPMIPPSPSTPSTPVVPSTPVSPPVIIPSGTPSLPRRINVPITRIPLISPPLFDSGTEQKEVFREKSRRAVQLKKYTPTVVGVESKKFLRREPKSTKTFSGLEVRLPKKPRKTSGKLFGRFL